MDDYFSIEVGRNMEAKMEKFWTVFSIEGRIMEENGKCWKNFSIEWKNVWKKNPIAKNQAS